MEKEDRKRDMEKTDSRRERERPQRRGSRRDKRGGDENRSVCSKRSAHRGSEKKTAFEVREENKDVLCTMVQALVVVVTGAREARGAGVLAGDAVVLRTIWRRRLVCC